MKGLNKLVLASAIAAISAGAQAELKALDDSAMGELTGQAGLTIDIETEWTIGEFAYKDGGSLLIQGISMGSSEASQAADATDTMLDNIRLNLDVADGTETFHYGFSEITELAGILATDYGNGDTTVGAIAAGKANLNGQATAGQGIGEVGDGDLVIHVDATDHLHTLGGFQAMVDSGDAGTIVFADLKPAVHNAVDFGFSIDAIKIASSDYDIGSGVAATAANAVAQALGQITGVETFDGTGASQSTTLISDLSVNGFLGPVDILIENHGNGFGSYDAAGVYTADANDIGDAASKIHWDSYVDVTDLDVYIDIAGLRIEDMKINNTRGDRTNIDSRESFGFAHSKRDIFAVKDTVLQIGTLGTASNAASTNLDNYVDGIAINTQFKGDMEIGHLSFGDTGESIGEIYLTDIVSTTNWTISAH